MKIRENGSSEYTMAEIQQKSSLFGFSDSLTKEMTALAKDADLSAKAATGKLKFADALKDSEISTNDLGSALKAQLKESGEKDWLKELADAAEQGGEVKALSESDAVINNKSFRNLLNFSANPVEVLRDAILGNQVIPKDLIDVSTPVAPVTNNVTNNITNTVNIDVDNPADYNEFYKEIMTRFQNDKKAETMVQDMTIGRLNGKSNFYKYRTKF